jgi:hypothetical protein
LLEGVLDSLICFMSVSVILEKMPSLVVVLQEETGHEGEPGKHIAAIVCLNERLLQMSGEVIRANDQVLILGVTDGVPIVICSDKRSIYEMV